VNFTNFSYAILCQVVSSQSMTVCCGKNLVPLGVTTSHIIQLSPIIQNYKLKTHLFFRLFFVGLNDCKKTKLLQI